MKARKFLIAGNWKMNKTAAEGAVLVREVVAAIGPQTEVDVVVCPPFTALESVSRAVEGSAIKLGAQNMHPQPSGAFTGEVSAEMLRGLFASYVILGHSERRQYFAETDAFINQKVHAAIKSLLKPILCIGETLAERDASKTIAVVKTQLEAQAQEVHAAIREWLTARFGKPVAQKVRILYGGSMKPANAPELLKQEDVDGGLIGGASLEVNSFVDLIKAAKAQS
jgi:triosephosphate isomerase